MRITEITLLALTVISGIWLYALLPGGEHMVMIVMSLLSLLYFGFGFLIFSQVGLRSSFKGGLQGISAATILASIVTGIAASIVIIGMLFKIMILPGADEMLIIGSFATTFLFVVSVFRFTRSKNAITRFTLGRITIFCVVGTILWSIPSLTLVEVRYRNHPRYVEAYSNFVADRKNPERWKALELEYRRVYSSPEEFSQYERSLGK
jgi:hypothetical protein